MNSRPLDRPPPSPANGPAEPADTPRPLVVAGAGGFARQLLRELGPAQPAILLDRDPERLRLAGQELPGLDTRLGDACSLMTWRALMPLDPVALVAAVPDPEANLEICRLVREHLRWSVPLLALVQTPPGQWEERFAGLGAEVLRPYDPGVAMVRNRLSRGVARAQGIGLSRGELIEVTVQAPSHLVDRELAHIHPTRWHVAAIYRQGELILPQGRSTLRRQDRVVLVGDPGVLDSVARILCQGEPQFPLQYGPRVTFPLTVRHEAALSEALDLIRCSRAQGVTLVPIRGAPADEAVEQTRRAGMECETLGSAPAFRDLLTPRPPAGLLVVPATRKGWSSRSRVRQALRLARGPVLVARRGAPSQGLWAGLNTAQPALALEVGMELARLTGLPLRAVFVTPPEPLRGTGDEDGLRYRRQLVTDYETLHTTRIPLETPEGNPIRATLALLRAHPADLAVLVDDAPGRPASLLQPRVTPLIARGATGSVLILPGDAP